MYNAKNIFNEFHPSRISFVRVRIKWVVFYELSKTWRYRVQPILLTYNFIILMNNLSVCVLIFSKLFNRIIFELKIELYSWHNFLCIIIKKTYN